MTQQKVVLIISDLKEIASAVRLNVGSKSTDKFKAPKHVTFRNDFWSYFNFGLQISLPPKY